MTPHHMHNNLNYILLVTQTPNLKTTRSVTKSKVLTTKHMDFDKGVGEREGRLVSLILIIVKLILVKLSLPSLSPTPLSKSKFGSLKLGSPVF